MIGKTILHYKILEKLGESCPPLDRGGLVHRSQINNREVSNDR
jgi:hypothetical protein